MKEKEKLKAGKFLRVIIILVAVAILAAAGLTVKTIIDSKKTFYQDGYILVPSTDKMVTTNVNEQYYFSEGTKYQNKLGDMIVFKDTSDKQVSVNTTQFIHYMDGALGAFAKGVVLDLADLGQEQVKYYGMSEKTIITKKGIAYSMSYLGKSMDMNEFIWKISDDSYMLVSPSVTLHLNNTTDVVLEDYVQVQYVAGGVARLVHKDGTYQTVADDAYVKTDSGLELRLTSRCFYKDGAESVSLNSMVIDSSTNLAVDENEDELKLPTFHVINGKDGVSGSNGSNGENGYEGETGDDGTNGGSGGEGQDGYDGVQGNGGEWGYDGKDGVAGENAENAGASDGVASIDQLQAPKVTLETETYVVGPNSITMNLLVEDKNAMLDSDLEWNIYSRDDMKLCANGAIPRGVTGQIITTSNLVPGTEYVLVVSGDYTNEGYSYSTDFLTKIFKTDSVGISIEKVKVTENSIIVKTVKDDASQVGTYKIALYMGKEGTANICTYMVDYSEGREFIFDASNGMVDGVEITADTEYYVRLYDVTDATTGSLMSADVFKSVTTLKETPHYKMEIDSVITKVPVSNKLTKTVTSSRYQSVAVSLDNSIVDPNNGIIGYRYELFEVSSIVGSINDAIPTQLKETEEAQTVNFDIDPEKSYIARAVVIFFDNEKKVELAAQQSAVFKLEQSTYPSVSFVNVTNEYDSVTGYIMVEDNSNGHQMLLNHVIDDYPIVLTIAARVGDPITIKLDDDNEVTPPAGSESSANIKYYYFTQDGLSRGTPYSMTVSAYVNESGKTWQTLIDEGVAKNCFQYVAGANFNSGDPTPFVINASEKINSGSNLFAVNIGFSSGTDEHGNPLDASYEVGNLEKLTFTLINANTGVVLGSPANIIDTHKIGDYEPLHESIFYNEAYVANGETPKYSDNIVLTDASFGVEGDSRIAAGGKFQIRVESAYDYTQRDSYKDFTNDMIIDESSYIVPDNKVIFEFEVEQRHVPVSNPNDTVIVTPIENQYADEYDDTLDDDTVVGLKIDSGYTLNDATSVIYYIYEVTSATGEPFVDDNSTSVLSNKTWADPQGNTYDPVAVKTIQITTSPTEGDGVEPWVVYFSDRNGSSETNNLDDGGKVIFERGKMYFVRYEIVTDGRLEDVNVGEKYPACVYKSVYNDPNDYPYYRSKVIMLKRQAPSVQRYLWDVTTSGNITTNIWKYKINDPDNAVLTYFSGNKDNARMVINQYTDFNSAIEKTNGSSLVNASITNLYGTGTTFVNSYEDVTATNLTNGNWYTLSLPYCVYGNQIKADSDYVCIGKDSEGNKIYEPIVIEMASVPTQVQSVSAIKTDMIKTENTDPKHTTDNTDYAVSGVMVKGILTNLGLIDDYGYRIRLTLQGDEIERVAAIKVVIKGVKNGNPVTVTYDPVEVVMADGKSGNKYKNNYAYAYLEYAPIVEAGINNTTVTVDVSAYYTTYQGGMKSFTEPYAVSHVNNFTNDGLKFTNGNAWAIKAYSYNFADGSASYDYSYQKIVEASGNFTSCGVMIKDNSVNVETKVLSGSVFIPFDNGFSNGNLKFTYATKPIVYTTFDNNSFADVKFNKSMEFTMDEIGAMGTDGKYYQLEKLNLAPLQIDCGEETGNYFTADFNAGDGMPGIAFSDALSSSGMKSVYAVFDIKGELPGTDKGYYVYLYDNKGNKINLDKYENSEGAYYLVEGQDKTTSSDALVASDDTGNDKKYGTTADSNKVEFSIRGLESGKVYLIKIMAKNSKDTMQYLFDYAKNAGALDYQMTTTDRVVIDASGITFKYNMYNNKVGSINYNIEGSEGTGMRIFYKVYKNDVEVKCGLQEYKAGFGYLLVPKGNLIKYYHSDKTQCNPVSINFNPGMLVMGGKYKVVFMAYPSDNSGNITDNNDIGSCEVYFDVPSVLSKPTAAMQVISGKDSIQVTGSVTDINRTIMGDTFEIAVYDLDGNKVSSTPSEITKDIASGATKAEFSGEFTGLVPNSAYIIKVTANIDTNNDGNRDDVYEYALAGNTVSTASATVSVSYTVNEELVLSLEKTTNFNNVDKVLYTIDSSDGKVNYFNGEFAWPDGNPSAYTQPTSHIIESGQYSYTLQYYDETGKLLGSNTGRFNK